MVGHIPKVRGEKMKDQWIKNGSIFVCDNYKYGIAPDGATVCAGPVEEEMLVGETTPNVIDTIQIKPVVVLQQPTKGNLLTVGKKQGVMQHRGRPRKEGKVHRTTEWRRRQEHQGVLL